MSESEEQSQIERSIDILMLLNEAIKDTCTVDEGLHKIVDLTCRLMDRKKEEKK